MPPRPEHQISGASSARPESPFFMPSFRHAFVLFRQLQL